MSYNYNNNDDEYIKSRLFNVISCGNCLSVLTVTPKNKPVLNNGVYWYLNTYSFGFSSSYNIKQEPIDVYDCNAYKCNTGYCPNFCSDNKRFSLGTDERNKKRLGQGVCNRDYANTSFRIIILLK